MLTVYLDVQGVLQSLNAEKEYKKTGEKEGLTFLNGQIFVEDEKVSLIKDFCEEHNAQVVFISNATAPYSVPYDTLKNALDLPMVDKEIQEDYYANGISGLKGPVVEEHSKKHGLENHVVFDDQWQRHFSDNWGKCVRKIDPKEGIDERSIDNAERVLQMQERKRVMKP
jgi:transposase-like protein